MTKFSLVRVAVARIRQIERTLGRKEAARRARAAGLYGLAAQLVA